MQTFLPIADFRRSAECLDNRRLGKQRVEVLQIYNALTGKKTGWYHHPAVQMWLTFEEALLQYGMTCCDVWSERGFKDSVWFQLYLERKSKDEPKMPPWFGLERFHSSHRSNLLRKDKDHYGKFGWTENPYISYYWPLYNESKGLS